MLLRWSLGLVLSVVAHAAVVVVGLAMGSSPFMGPVEVEIAGVSIEEVKDLPLGRPDNGEAKAEGRARQRSRAPETPPAEGTLASRSGKDDRPQARPRPMTRRGRRRPVTWARTGPRAPA